MPQKCAKCESDRIIPNVRMLDCNENWSGNLQAEVYEYPDALLFKGTVRTTLTAKVCGNCGYTELYASDPHEMWRAHQNAAGSR